MDIAYKLFKIMPGDERYKRALNRETAYWDSLMTDDFRKNISRRHPVVQEYENTWITGDREKSWRNYIGETYGQFENGLSLGGGIGYEEKKLLDLGLLRKLDFIELGTGSIERFKERVKCEPYAEHINYTVADINFVELEPNKYDFILCFTILHHIVNLEHVAYQINKALKNNGILVVGTNW